MASFEESSTDLAYNFASFGHNEPCMLGIDEAGRGPVLGPMVYGCAVAPLSKSQQLMALEFADSKQLTEEKREELFNRMSDTEDDMRQIVSFAVQPYVVPHDNSFTDGRAIMADWLSARRIASSMLRRIKCSLNEISHSSAMHLIQTALDNKINVVEVYVDTVGPPEFYQRRLSERFPSLSVTVSRKADSIYPIVSAASVAAKVTRDRLLKNWQFVENLDLSDWGSGYPSDPMTKRFMTTSIDPVFGYPSLVRFSWKTAQVKLDTFAAKCKWEDDENEKSGNRSILNFVKSKNDSATARHPFFTDRCLHSAAQI